MRILCHGAYYKDAEVLEVAAVFNKIDDCEDRGGWVVDVGSCCEFGVGGAWEVFE